MNEEEERLYVTRPSLAPLEELLPYLRSIWESRVLTNGGRFHRQLEEELCNYLGVQNVSLFANGTIPLMIALKALEVTGQVITTPYTFVATAHSLLWNGLEPVFVDIDPDTFNIDPGKIEAAITPRTTAIMPVHCYGRPCDIESIDGIAREHHLKVIYDAAHAFGVSRAGKSILNGGDLSTLSFHATKVFTTFEGGAIVSHESATKKRIDQLKNFGYVDEVTVASAGINGKMNEFSAALGLVQLRHFTGEVEKRKAVDAYYRESLSEIEGVRCASNDKDTNGNYSYFPILLDDAYPLGRDALYDRLRSSNIYARRYFYPLVSDFPMYRRLPSAAKSNLPVANRVAERVLCLPLYSSMTRDDVDRVASVIEKR